MTYQRRDLDNEVNARLRDIATQLRAEIERLRAALYEATTNGRWTEGEQRGDWAISNAVYEAMRDALDDQSASAPCETCDDDPEECAKVPGMRHCEKAQRGV